MKHGQTVLPCIFEAMRDVWLLLCIVVLKIILQSFQWTGKGSQDAHSGPYQYCCIVCNNIWDWSLWSREGICSSWITWGLRFQLWRMLFSFHLNSVVCVRVCACLPACIISGWQSWRIVGVYNTLAVSLRYSKKIKLMTENILRSLEVIHCSLINVDCSFCLHKHWPSYF